MFTAIRTLMIQAKDLLKFRTAHASGDAYRLLPAHCQAGHSHLLLMLLLLYGRQVRIDHLLYLHLLQVKRPKLLLMKYAIRLWMTHGHRSLVHHCSCDLLLSVSLLQIQDLLL